MIKKELRLKQLYLTLKHKTATSHSFDSLTNSIKLFLSSLTYLSLNIVNVSSTSLNDIPFNSIKLQQFLESMKELKEFHVYAKLDADYINSDLILLEFKNEYWFDHNLSFEMHQNYFYTLPFHFDYLYRFYGGFRSVKSNNLEILINDSRIWYYVKSIELERTLNYNTNIIKELKIKFNYI